MREGFVKCGDHEKDWCSLSVGFARVVLTEYFFIFLSTNNTLAILFDESRKEGE